MERIGAARIASYLDLAAGNRAVAKDANALVIERMPFAPRIGHLEECEFFFGKEVRIHYGTGVSRAEVATGYYQPVG